MSSYDDRLITPSLRRRRRRSGRRGCIFPYLLIVLVILGGFLAWYTRDSHPLRHLLPTGQTYNIVLVDIISNRSNISQSRVWEAMPDAFATEQMMASLGEHTQVPEWVINNIIGPTCFLTGNDLDEFGDVLFLTRMTRVGKIIEAFHRFFPGIEPDHAGGLKLRRLSEDGPYYAVRGRLLALSPCRETLIKALTLTDDHRIPQKTLDTALGESGAEQVRGIISLGPEDPLGDAFKSLSFALRIEPLSAQLEFRTLLTPDWEAKLNPILDNAQAVRLDPPVEGLIEVSANLGITLSEVWSATEAIFRDDDEPSAWDTWKDALEEDEQAELELFQALLGMIGPGLRLTWRDIDQHEMFPLPTFVATADARPGTVIGFFESLGPPPEDAMPWESFPRYDPEQQRLTIPMIGGPSFEPTFGLIGDALVASTSAMEADTLLSNPNETTTPFPYQGNLFIRVRPVPSVNELMDTGRLLASQNLLRGHSAESFVQTADLWERKAAPLDELTAVIAVDEDGSGFRGELAITCVPF